MNLYKNPHGRNRYGDLNKRKSDICNICGLPCISGKALKMHKLQVHSY